MTRELTIVGGGLAGLALGIGLRKHHIPVTIFEAGNYPRHRVCGEFICGVTPSTLENLGITSAFNAKVINHDSQWFYRDQSVLQRHLPTPAIGISRFHLDHQLATEFTRQGGKLETQSRISNSQLETHATIWACGRQRTTDSKWIGLKCHVQGFNQSMHTDLQMHFGHHCYVGISKVENNTVNVCGLFRQQRDLKATDRSQLLLTYLRASQLDTLATQLESAQMLPHSLLGVSAFQLGAQPNHQPARLHLGDSFSMIPPFTGNGMTMAFQSAELALQPLIKYATGTNTWQQSVNQINQAHHKKFTRRVQWALRLHPFLLNPIGQKTMVTAAKWNLIPFHLFFKKTR